MSGSGPHRLPPRVRPKTPGISPAARMRAYATGALVSLALLGVAYKAYGLQVESNSKFRLEAERQHSTTVELAAPRGEILDANGRALAVTADADSVWANPREVKDVAGTAEKLAKLTGGDVRSIESRLAAKRHFAWVARQVNPEVAAAVRAAKLPGVEVSREPKRWYPGGNIGGPIIGVANIDGEGLEGIELSMNELLTGRQASAAALRDARGRATLAGGLVEAEPGATVQLTLDRTVQAIADDALGSAMKAHRAKSGVVVVLDVATGQVLAMANAPTFDPNDDDDHKGARNRAITDVYEIGSVMKVFTIAAALDAGVTRPDDWWDVENGTYRIAGKTIRDTHHDPSLSTGGIIKRSSNVGAVKIAMRLGRDRLGAALRRYGFGAKTGIELPGEQGGRLRDPSRWREIELATVSFGYGLTVTPLQMAAAMAAIGNGGIYHEPRIISKVTSATGKVIYSPAPEARQVMKPRTAQQMLPMLKSVFDKGKQGGTAANVNVPGFTCGGKTGTAHKFDRATKRYSEDKYLSSFAGLAPIDNPRIAIVVIVDDPSGGDYFGGKVAAPVFAQVASETLRYLGVPGQKIVPVIDADGDGKPDQVEPDPEAEVLDIAAELTAAIGGDAELPDEELVADGAARVPDLRGLGMRKALDAAAAHGLQVELVGSGRVVAQEPQPGAAATGQVVTLTLSDGLRPEAPTLPTEPRARAPARR